MNIAFRLRPTTCAIVLSTCCALASLAAAGSVRAATVALTGLAEFAADSSGAASGQTFWNTLGGDTYFNLYVTAANSGINGAFLNSGDAAAAGINSSLGNGTYQFFIFGEPGADIGHFALNLFFNGSANPGISVFAATNTSATPPYPAYSADANANTRLLNGTTGAGVGTLTYTSGSSIVTLTAYQWSAPTVNNLDRISSFSTAPNGTNDFIGSFTLQVTTAVPEPKESFMIACGGLAVLGGVCLRRRLRRA